MMCLKGRGLVPLAAAEMEVPQVGSSQRPWRNILLSSQGQLKNSASCRHPPSHGCDQPGENHLPELCSESTTHSRRPLPCWQASLNLDFLALEPKEDEQGHTMNHGVFNILKNGAQIRLVTFPDHFQELSNVPQPTASGTKGILEMKSLASSSLPARLKRSIMQV
ncbi:hypothetical protein Cgig2_022771 [Carnegiea gigantea]|uniref:Uncharacterized protein n=1 Tax=Carnegiea gigantea TaxID=171969 RepID=A0A9Q1KCD6_9CARY|nr:hypothetical protein Cgig2_022771 [Carnegiea gigantea]